MKNKHLLLIILALITLDAISTYIALSHPDTFYEKNPHIASAIENKPLWYLFVLKIQEGIAYSFAIFVPYLLKKTNRFKAKEIALSESLITGIMISLIIAHIPIIYNNFSLLAEYAL